MYKTSYSPSNHASTLQHYSPSPSFSFSFSFSFSTCLVRKSVHLDSVECKNWKLISTYSSAPLIFTSTPYYYPVMIKKLFLFSHSLLLNNLSINYTTRISHLLQSISTYIHPHINLKILFKYYLSLFKPPTTKQINSNTLSSHNIHKSPNISSIKPTNIIFSQ